jgi:hypothetical protein
VFELQARDPRTKAWNKVDEVSTLIAALEVAGAFYVEKYKRRRAVQVLGDVNGVRTQVFHRNAVRGR